MQKASLPHQCLKILQRLFVFVDTRDAVLNNKLKLVVNPQIIKIVLKQTQNQSISIKMDLLQELSSLYLQNPINSLILAKRDRQIMQFNHSILDSLISYMFSLQIQQHSTSLLQRNINSYKDLQNVCNQKETVFKNQISLVEREQKIKKMVELITPFVRYYYATPRVIKSVLSFLAKDFYNDSSNPEIMQLSVSILKRVIQLQTWQSEEPNCYFVMYGEETGIKMINRGIKWPFSKGFHLYLKFYIQQFLEQDMNLFTLAVAQDDFGLLLSPEGELKVKIFGTQSPLTISCIPKGQWVTLALSYTIRTKLLRNFYQLICIIDGQIHERRDLPVPAVSMGDEIAELNFGHSLYGKLHCAFLSRSELVLSKKMIFQNWSEIQSFLVINKRNLRELFLFYHPLLISSHNQKQLLYDISSQNHGELYDNTGVYSNPLAEVDVNYYGGLYTYLPLFHLLKFYKYSLYPKALTHQLQLFLLLFEQQFTNVEKQALNCQFFSIVRQLINEADPNFIQLQTISIIAKIGKLLQDQDLKKQFLMQFIWKINIRRLEDCEIVESIVSIIQQQFLCNFKWCVSLLGIDSLLHYLIDYFEPQYAHHCCFYHFSHCQQNAASKSTDDPINFKNSYLSKTKTFKNIIKTVFVNLVDVIDKASLRPLQYKFMQVLFQSYSPCLKLMLLQGINQGTKRSAIFYNQQFNVLHYVYLYLQTAYLPEQIAYLTEILLNCQDQDEDNVVLQNNIIRILSSALDRIYTKKCQDGRSRSRSDRLKAVRSTSNQRNYSGEKRKIQKALNIGQVGRWSQRSFQKNKALYSAIVKFCFYYDASEQQCLLKKDEYVRVLQPYFRLSSLQFRKDIINMIRNTVILASKGKSIMANLTNFDKLYKLLLTQFVLRQLQPTSPEYCLSEPASYIIRNVYFIIDYMVMGMRNDWIHLYAYLLRLLGLLEEAKKDIHKKSERSQEEISTAVVLSMKKFVLRVVRLAEKDVHNLPNLVFLVYLTVFTNKCPPLANPLFHHFGSLQKHLFLGKLKLRSQIFDSVDKVTFVDSRLILQTLGCFHLCNIDLCDSSEAKVMKLINSFLDVQYTNQDSQLFKNRNIYLITAKFQTIKNDTAGIKELFNGLFSQTGQDISTGQIISVLSCLCIEAAISTQDIPLLQQSVKMLQQFMFAFLLLGSRDGLKREQSKDRNKQLPKTILCSVLHFLFQMLNSSAQLRQVVQDTLYHIFCFIGLLVTCLRDKLGGSDNFDKALELTVIMKSVEQYNFFLFQLLKEVITLKKIVNIPNNDKSQALKIIHHQSLRQYFKAKAGLSVERKIEEATDIHLANVQAIKKQIQLSFAFNHEQTGIKHDFLLNAVQFEKVFVLDYLRSNNLSYRGTQRIWRKIWKRLRLYHYFWSTGMNQRQTMNIQFNKESNCSYKHKFSKFVDCNGSRSILQTEPVEPRHVMLVLLQKQFQYRSSKYLYHLHHEIELKKKQKTLFQKLLRGNSSEGTSYFVDWIKNNSKRKGFLSIEGDKLKFKYLSTFQKDSHLQFSSFILAEHKPIQKYWPLIQIENIIERRYLTKKQCLLIQFEEGTSLIFNFLNDEKDDFLKLIEQKQAQKNDKMALLKLNKVSFYTKKFGKAAQTIALEQATTAWRNNKMINKYSGRSYLDPANYPVFPWIIASYDYKQYQYRDLSKPMGALGSESRVSTYRSKIQAYDPFDPVPAYQYGTHYSSPGMVFNFLIRLQPYTEAGRTLQGGKFDLSDRLFSSVKICWDSVTSQTSDVRQLIPEFYYLPQFLLNIEQFDFGITQKKQRIHNVVLPLWSSNAYDYITIQRKQLQSEAVSDNINNWIDLVFGFKQKGKIAQQNLNLFFYLTYEDAIDISNIQDPQTRISRQAQIFHFGQTPSQLFLKPHPNRNKLPKHKIPFPLKKVTLLLSRDSRSPVSILSCKQNGLILFHQYGVYYYQQKIALTLQSQVRLLRNNSRQNIYFTEQVQFSQRVYLFANNKFIIIASYVNGDVIIYSLPDARKVAQKKGFTKNCIYVNAREDLLFCGCRNGLLQVYQIVYGEKQTLTLIKIAAEYYLSPITSISEGGNTYAITTGNLVVLVKISRSLAYVNDKIKMKGFKMLRSIQSQKSIKGAIICCDPLSCVVFYNSLQLFCYGINGQLLKIKQVQMSLAPVKLTDNNFCQYIAVVSEQGLVFYSIPFLQAVRVIGLPSKQYRQIIFFDNRCYLTTAFGQIICLTESQQLEQD